jgi:hypothetical protein
MPTSATKGARSTIATLGRFFESLASDRDKMRRRMMARRRGATRRESAAFATALRRAAFETITTGADKGLRRLDRIAQRLVRLAEAGDIQAIKEIAFRLDGRPAVMEPEAGAEPQRVIVSWGDPIEPIGGDPLEPDALAASDPVRRLR